MGLLEFFVGAVLPEEKKEATPPPQIEAPRLRLVKEAAPPPACLDDDEEFKALLGRMDSSTRDRAELHAHGAEQLSKASEDLRTYSSAPPEEGDNEEG